MGNEKSQETVKHIIQEKLEATRANCRFKRAWIPDGWACVEIDRFAEDLAKTIQQIGDDSASP